MNTWCETCRKHHTEEEINYEIYLKEIQINKPGLITTCDNCGESIDWYIVPTGDIINFQCPYCFRYSLKVKIKDSEYNSQNEEDHINDT